MYALLLVGVMATAASANTRVSERVTIAPGVEMPLVNNGCLNNTLKGVSEVEALALWFQQGGRGVDTAQNYKGIDGCGQLCVGWGINNATSSSKLNLKREDLFVTTKIPCVGSATAALEHIVQDLAALNLTYVDLLIIHSPGFMSPAPLGQPTGCWGYHPCCNGTAELQDTYKGLEMALAKGLTRAIGVSNHRKEHLAAIMETATVTPAINQCQVEPTRG
jgi:diketogulonate reductase-like aldo/keto reductase